MMRKILLALPLVMMLAGCGPDDDFTPLDRLVLPAPLKLAHPASGKPDVSAFRKVYFDSSNGTAMFFVGDENSLTVQFITSGGLVDMNGLASQAALKNNAASTTIDASNNVNGLLERTMLPDRAFQLVPAQGGFLVQATYGKLTFLSYASVTGGQLKLGGRIDTTLLASLAKAAGVGGAYRTLPLFGNPQQNDQPDRLLLFTSVPDAMGDLVANNAGALFRRVTQDAEAWQSSEMTAPTSLSDTAAIEAIREHITGEDVTSNSMDTMNYSADDSMMAANAADPYVYDNTTTTVSNAM